MIILILRHRSEDILTCWSIGYCLTISKKKKTLWYKRFWSNSAYIFLLRREKPWKLKGIPLNIFRCFIWKTILVKEYDARITGMNDKNFYAEIIETKCECTLPLDLIPDQIELDASRLKQNLWCPIRYGISEVKSGYASPRQTWRSDYFLATLCFLKTNENQDSSCLMYLHRAKVNCIMNQMSSFQNRRLNYLNSESSK